MTTTGKSKLVEPLYRPYDDHSKAPNGLPLLNEWSAIPKGFYEVGKLTPTNFQREGNREVMLMNPCEPSPPLHDYSLFGS